MNKGRKKPVSKKTMALLDQLRRRQGIRELEKRILIVCEDTESSRKYFEALKKLYKLSATSVVVLGSGHKTQPFQVVHRALECQKDARRRTSGTEPFAEAWCIIDGDYGDEIDTARHLITDRTTFLAVSTPCFEYWVMLHFVENATPRVDCDEVISALRKGPIPAYEKGSFNYDDIVGRARDAAARARKLRIARIATDPLPENQNPCSEVYVLVERLLSP